MATITPSTSTVKIEIMLKDSSDTQILYWNSAQTPDYISDFTHVLRSGLANDVTLSIIHYIDPYGDTEFGRGFEKNGGDIYSTGDTSYMIAMLTKGINNIFFRYGYGQEDGFSPSQLTSNEEKSTKDNWFRMYITDVNESIYPDAIKYTISAVSTLSDDVNNTISEAYDFWTDPSKKLSLDPETLELTDSVTIKENKIKDRVLSILEWFADTNGYTLDIGNFMEGSLLINTNGSAVQTLFAKTADKSLLQYINSMLFALITYKHITKGSTSYVDGNGTTKTISDYYVYYKDYTLIISDVSNSINDKTRVKVTYTTKLCTMKNLADLMGHTNDLTALEKQYYAPFKTEVQSDGSSYAGSLFYNYSTFNRDAFEKTTITAGAIKSSSYNTNYPNMNGLTQNAFVSTDILELNLSFPILVGMAAAVSELNSNTTSFINTDGMEQIVNGTSNYYTNDYFNGVAVAQAILGTQMNFKKILGRLYAEGTIVIPGTQSVIPIMSQLYIYVYIANRLDVLSGKYIVLDQSDNISGGKFETTLSVMKVGTLNDENIYGTSGTTELQDILSNIGNGESGYSTNLFTYPSSISLWSGYLQDNRDLRTNGQLYNGAAIDGFTFTVNTDTNVTVDANLLFLPTITGSIRMGLPSSTTDTTPINIPYTYFISNSKLGWLKYNNGNYYRYTYTLNIKTLIQSLYGANIHETFTIQLSSTMYTYTNEGEHILITAPTQRIVAYL